MTDYGSKRFEPLKYQNLLVEVSEVISLISREIDVLSPQPYELHIKNELLEDGNILLKLATNGRRRQDTSCMDITCVIQQASDRRMRARESIFPKHRLLFLVAKDNDRPNGLLLKVELRRLNNGNTSA
jgi:hypothetical protein